MAKLWRKLKDPNILKRGWHLARLDTRNDFAEDLYSTESYGQELDKNIRETINRISTGTFQPKPLFRLEVPKGTLTFRPGTVVPIHDRVVISSIVLLLAPELPRKSGAAHLNKVRALSHYIAFVHDHLIEHGRGLLQRILQTRRDNWQGRDKYKKPATPDTSDLPELPEGWEWESLDSLANQKPYSIVDGPFASKLKRSHYTNNGVPPKLVSGFIEPLLSAISRSWRRPQPLL
jgi:hypothetical protein